MKTLTLKCTVLAFAIIILFSACDRDAAPVPSTPATPIIIKQEEMLGKYFAIHKNVGKAVCAITFINDGGIKFYFDAADVRRIGTPIIEITDSFAGTAVLKIDLNNNGVDVFIFDLKKSADGTTITLLGSKYHDVTTTIISSNMYDVQSLSGFHFNGLSLYHDNGDEGAYIYSFDATNCDYEYRMSLGGSIFGLAAYYPLTGNVAFKVDADATTGSIFGVAWMKSSGKMGFLIQNNNGLGIVEFEK